MFDPHTVMTPTEIAADAERAASMTREDRIQASMEMFAMDHPTATWEAHELVRETLEARL